MAFDFQRLQAALGMSVKLTLTCGVFQGVLHHINPSCDLLLLHTGWGCWWSPCPLTQEGIVWDYHMSQPSTCLVVEWYLIG